MAKSDSQSSNYDFNPNDQVDEIEQSIELLDKVLSEFEDPESLPHIEPDSPSQGNQSEDDGYMSMNGRRAKFSPTFQPMDETPTNPVLGNSLDEFIMSSSPEGTDCLISTSPPIFVPSPSPNENENGAVKSDEEATVKDVDKEIVNNTDKLKWLNSETNSENIIQTTLPKARPMSVITSKYASLPGSSPPRLKDLRANTVDTDDGNRMIKRLYGSENNSLGIGITALHNTVLYGMPNIPEKIINEHPVTIYPGRTSPKRIPPRTVPGSSVERHRDVCRKSTSDSQNSNEFTITFIDNNKQRKSHLSPSERPSQIPVFRSSQHRSEIKNICDISPVEVDDISAEHSRLVSLSEILYDDRNEKSVDLTQESEATPLSITDKEDEFSDDSLEGVSLPQPPPPPIVPPPPSLSAPVTPSKRGSIAWEIKLDCDEVDNVKKSRPMNTSQPSLVLRDKGNKLSEKRSAYGSQSSMDTKNSISLEWPDPPDQPICSTEDEAASIYSDSAEEILPFNVNMNPTGTYVIRKGRKDRGRLIDIDSMSSINSKLSNEEIVGRSSAGMHSSVYLDGSMSSMLTTPQSRHSIDLGAQSNTSILNSPRSRFSLDISSPTSDFALTNNTHHMNWHRNNARGVTSSPQHNPYKTTVSIKSGNDQYYNVIGSMDDQYHMNDNNSNYSMDDRNTHNIPLMRASSLPTIPPQKKQSTFNGDSLSTPRRELAPPIEEDEDLDSESQKGAPLRQIENNISALLRGDISIARVADIAPPRRPMGFRPGVHKSESAKEMLLSQQQKQYFFGPLPPSPVEDTVDCDFPSLPPSPQEEYLGSFPKTSSIKGVRISSRSHGITTKYSDQPPVVPPHAHGVPSLNTLKTRSMDAGFTKSRRSSDNYLTPSPQERSAETLPQDFSVRHVIRHSKTGATPKRPIHSPRSSEHRLQTSCSLPETPIFARGCDVSRPNRRVSGKSVSPNNHSVSHTAPRPNPSMSPSIHELGNSFDSDSQRCIVSALANNEMLRMAGGPARGWYPKQRNNKPVSTEHLDRLHPLGSVRAWDSGTNSRKPFTLPPNITPKFFHKSPRAALRRVTSLLIRKGGNTSSKERNKSTKREKTQLDNGPRSPVIPVIPVECGAPIPTPKEKKKGFFKSFWKKSKHISLEK